MKIRCFAILSVFCSFLSNQVLAATDAVLVDAAQEAAAGILDVSALADNLRIANIDSLTQIITATGQSICLDGLELNVISEVNETLTIRGNGSVDIINSSLTLPNDGSAPTVVNLLALEFEGLAASNSLVPERLTVGGSHSDAIAAFWIQLDQLYVGASDFYNLAINTSFVYLGNDYARYLSAGSAARLDIVKIASDRLQTLHDNLLGNLGDAPIASRFTNLGESEPRTTEGASFGERLYNRGTASAGLYTDQNLVSSVIGWDLVHGVVYPSMLPFPFAVFGSASKITGTSAADVVFPGGGDDVVDAGSGVDTVAYSGEAADYSISSDSSRFIVADSVVNRDGTDSLAGVEKLQFTDSTLFLAGGNDYTVQLAIDAASSADTIIVAAGTHNEALTVNKALSLLGEQAGIDARGRSGSAETIIEGSITLQGAADNAIIDGFTIREGGNIGGEYAGIFLASGASDVTIRNTVFARSGDVDGDSYRGILTTSNGGNSDLLITQNSFSGWATGVFLNPAATDAVVSNNSFDGNFVGMSIDGPSNTNVVNNDFLNNEFEGLGIGPGVDSPTMSFADNSFQLNTTHIGIYTDITLALSANTFDTAVTVNQSSFVYTSIQDGIDAASEGDTVSIDSGTYLENVAINKPITLSGAGTSTVIAPASGNAIAITGNILAGSDGVPGISGVAVENMGIVGASGSFGIIALSNAVPADEYDTAAITIRNVTIDTSAPSFGIGLFDVNGATIEDVTISGYDSDSVGAFELVGVAGLSMNNVIIDGDALSFKIFEVDGYAQNGNVQIRNSILSSMVVEGSKAIVDATRNWWGSASNPGDKIIGDALFDPWYVNAALSQLSDFVPPVVVVEEPDSGGNEEIDTLIDDIVITEDEEVTEEVIEAVSAAADAADTLAQDVVETIDDVDEDTAIEALSVLSRVAEVSGKAAANTVGSGNAAGAESAGANGSKTIAGFANVLSALDNKLASSGASQVLSVAQKSAVQDATVKAVASAVQVLLAPSTTDNKSKVLKNLGSIISSSANLGVTITDDESSILFEATEQPASPDADLDTQLEASIPIQPTNKQLVSREVLGAALEGSGISEEELTVFLADLANAINPADVNIGSLNGQDSLSSGLNEALVNQQGSVEFDADTGIIFFSIADQLASAFSNVDFSALSSAPQSVPARVVSANIVSSNFPDGISVKADGSVVITNARIASIIVPAAYDPINLYADLRKLGLVSSAESDGNILIRDGGVTFTATFDFAGTVNAGEKQLSTTFTLPSGIDESDLQYNITVNYRDGSRQVLQPFIAVDEFINSLRDTDIAVSMDRNNGTISSGGVLFRPSYFQNSLNGEASSYWLENKDRFGIAYRVLDINGDGLMDFSVLSQDGSQSVYRVYGQ